MSAHHDLLIIGGTCVLAWGETAVDIGISDGRIAWIGQAGQAVSADSTVDARGLHVLPGLIDPHVHLRDPGDRSVESLGSGTRAAVLGGLTCVFDMPNTTPPITDAARVGWKQAYAEREAWCDVGLYVGATKANIGELAELELMDGVAAVKVFAGSSTGDLLVEDDASIEAVLRAGRRRVAFHSEDEYRLQARREMFRTGDPYRCHMEWRDPECAFLGTRRIMALTRMTGRPTHVLHVSTAEEFEYLQAFRDVATVEVLVNHLTQVGPECYDALGGYAVMNPPIRDRRHYEAAWDAVRDGRVDTIGSDHAPHSRAAKERPWPDCAAGLTGVQTLVPLMLDHVAAGRLTLGRMVDLMSAGPARVYGLLCKGRLASGYDGDLTLVDLKRRQRIDRAWIASPVQWTPFEGREVVGWPVMTVVRGQVVMRDDEVLGEPAGRLARFA